jgi:hypothetical protein
MLTFSRAVVKSSTSDHEERSLQREYRACTIPEIAAGPYIRRLVDTVPSSQNQDNPSSLVFEWMNRNLADLPAGYFRAVQYLPKIVARSVLSALEVFKTLNAIHAGWSRSSPH